MTERQIAYQAFLKTPLWDALRRECYRLADDRCARCGASGCQLHAHHWRYPETWEKTTQDDLECLCFKCHGVQHGKMVVKPSKQKRKFRKRRWSAEKARRAEAVASAARTWAALGIYRKWNYVNRGTSSN